MRYWIFAIFILFFLSFSFANTSLQEACYSDACFYSDCRTVTLSPDQVQSIWNNFLYNALKPEEMRSGKQALPTASKEDQIKKAEEDCPEINVIDKENAIGNSISIGCEKQGADKQDVKFNLMCQGDYAIAMVLDSTLRVARCKDLNNSECSVYGSSLQYSNAESGGSLALASLSAIISPSAASSDFTTKDKISEEEFLKNSPLKEPRPEIDINDLNGSGLDTLTANYFKRDLQDEKIKNHIEVSNFNAMFEDVCTGSDASDRCRIYIFSFFNKFYNSYYSGTMVTTTFGPAIYGLSKKVIGIIPGARNLFEAAESRFGNIATKLKAATKKKFSEAPEATAIKHAENLRLSGTFKDLKADDLKKFEAMFVEGSSDKIRQTFDGSVVKALDTPEKRSAFARYLESKVTYGRTFAQDVAEANKTSIDDAVKMIIAQDKKSAAMGSSVLDVFYEKNGSTYGKYFIKSDKVAAEVSVTHKLAKEKVLQENVELYVSGPGTSKGLIALDKLDDLAKSDKAYFFNDPSGTKRYITPDSLDSIKAQFSSTGTVPVFEAGGFQKVADVEAKKVLDEMRKEFVKMGEKNAGNSADRANDLLKTMYERDLIPKKYWNLMQYTLYNGKFVNRDHVIRSAATWLVAPQAYWILKTSDSSPFKAYFVNEREMSNVTISTGQASVYNDAYMDIFSNEKFSSGDFFGEVFVQSIAKTAGDLLDRFDAEKILNFAGIKSRDTVEDIAFYTSTKGDCADCISSRQIVNGKVDVVTDARNDTVNYVLELPDTKVAEEGLSLALYTHHTNIDFNLTSTSSENNITDNINIADAISKKTTCVDRVKTSIFSTLPFFDDYFNSNASRTGLVMGILDHTLFYGTTALLPGFAGIALGMLGSYIVNSEFMDHFADCVDSEEGYYIHYTHKFEEESAKQSTLTSLVSEGKEKVPETSDALNKVNSVMDDLKSKIVDIVQNKDKEFMQIKYNTFDDSKAKFETNGLFINWLGKRATCDKLSEDKESVVSAIAKDQNGNAQILTIDSKSNTLSLNGKVFLQSELVSLATQNGVFGGYEMPQSSTFIPLNGVDSFELYSNGDYKILDPSIEICFMNGAKTQTGLNYVNPLQYTGLIQRIVGKESGIFTPRSSEFLVLGGPIERADIKGTLLIDSNVNIVTATKDLDFGKLASIQFEKAIMIYRETEKDLVLWIKIIAQINGRDVQKFFATPTTVTNPDTGCEEQAFDLSVLGNELDSTAKQKGIDFDNALKHAGPFQYFETPDVILMFYSKEESGECKSYMKAIDKKTGKIISDAEITSFSQNPDGTFNITTEDGKTHSIGFTNENGTPMLSYNGKKAPLTMAQGRNGSFYFNPDTQEWTVANSQMLPFSDKFAEQGWLDVGGITKPGENPMYKSSTLTGKEGSWDIPLFEGFEKILLVLASVFFVAFAMYFNFKKNF